MTIPNYKQRLDLFRKSKKINQKNYKWRYTVIPSDWLAQMGFYFDPIEQENTDLILKDAINCIYCHRHTFDLKHCRSKSKDKLETISNVLLQHLNGDNLNCPISYLRLKIIKDFKYSLGTSNWSNDPIFSDPFNLITRNIFRTSFLDLNSNQNWNKDKINDVINAGLIHFDLSFNAFNKNDYIIDTPTTSLSASSSGSSSSYDIVFCIYCKNIIRLNFNDTLKPIERHFLACHNGHCYFFKKLIQMFPEFKDLKNIHEFNIVDETEPTDSMDSIIHNSLLYENLTKDDITDSKYEDTKNIQVNSEVIQEQLDKTEEPKSLNHSPGNIEVNNENMDENNMDSNPNQDDDMTSEKSSTGYDYESSSESQSIEENDPTYQDDMDSEVENEEKMYHKIEKKPALITFPNTTNTNISNNDNNLNDRKQITKDQTTKTTNPRKMAMTKRKKLLGKSPQRIVSNTDTTLNDEVSSERSANLSKNKDLVLNFTDHVNRKKDITRTNKILDDSADDFSFSNNGSHSFQLSPLKKLESPISKKNLVSDKQYTPSVKFPETKDGQSKNNTNLQTPIYPDKQDEAYDKKSLSVYSEVRGIEKNIQSPTVSSIIHVQKQQNTSLIHDEEEQYIESTNPELKDQILLDMIPNDTAIILLPADSSNENKKIDSTNGPAKDNKNFIVQKENNLNIHNRSPKINNESKSNNVSETANSQSKTEKALIEAETVHETSFKRSREELIDQQLSTIKRKKNSNVSNIENEKDNNIKHDTINPAGRILSGASMVTKIPNAIINKNNMKENQANVQKINDFLTSSSSITEDSDHYIPSPEKNIISSSLLPQEKKLSYRRLRHT